MNKNLLTLAIATVLGGCASAPPASSQSATKTGAATAATPGHTNNIAVGYRRVMRGGQEYFCKKEPVTGSRTDTNETCLTQAQMDAAQKNTQDMLQRLQQNPGTPSGPGGAGGAYNNVMTR
jgi:hypothetical protein